MTRDRSQAAAGRSAASHRATQNTQNTPPREAERTERNRPASRPDPPPDPTTRGEHREERRSGAEQWRSRRGPAGGGGGGARGEEEVLEERRRRRRRWCCCRRRRAEERRSSTAAAERHGGQGEAGEQAPLTRASSTLPPSLLHLPEELLVAEGRPQCVCSSSSSVLLLPGPPPPRSVCRILELRLPALLRDWSGLRRGGASSSTLALKKKNAHVHQMPRKGHLPPRAK
ncbi:hypothetical protein CRUP_015224 [Coryphaenoides rupestris]|nr:hypothetical protein CRUP_015224 [Coryphaenoides rupestris]